MANRFKLSPFRWCFIALLVVGAFGVYFLVSRGVLQRSAAPGAASTVYVADTPLETSPEVLLPGYIMLSINDLENAPEVDGFQYPCGATNGAFSYDAQPFGTMNKERGGYHVGADLNGIGGENTDEGLPVCASARGLVVYCGKPSEDWGNVVVLAHRMPGTNRIVQTLYAHLNEISVARGAVVARGERVGSIGTAGGRYFAHLHFEIIESRCTEAGMPGYHATGTMNRLDPEAFLAQHPAPPMPDVYRDVWRLKYAPSRIPLKEGRYNISPDSQL